VKKTGEKREGNEGRDRAEGEGEQAMRCERKC